MEFLQTITIPQLIFYFFSSLALMSAAMVVISKNTVRSVLYLIFSFFCTAGLWMLMQSEFLAIILVLVYVGAVMVLFLFVVMMIDVEAPQLQGPFVRYWPFAIIAAGVMFGLTVYVVGPEHFGLNKVPLPPALPEDYSQVKALGRLLYSDFLLPFEIAGVILLVAMIAAIGLTFRGMHDSLAQKPGQQVRVRKQDRLRIISMPPETGDRA
jgi:NADH-quinone oxidoreductase subunit J